MVQYALIVFKTTFILKISRLFLMKQLLKGYKVLDFGRYIAAPYCASLLGQMGAEVIRIERPGGSEDRYLAPITPAGDGAMYMQMNAHK